MSCPHGEWHEEDCELCRKDDRVAELDEQIAKAELARVADGFATQEARCAALEAEVNRLQEGRYHYLHKCLQCNAELPWTDGTEVEYWCQNCGKEQPASFTEVRWTP